MMFGWFKPKPPKPRFFVREVTGGWLAVARITVMAAMCPPLRYLKCLDANGQPVCDPREAPMHKQVFHATQVDALAAIDLRRELESVIYDA